MRARGDADDPSRGEVSAAAVAARRMWLVATGLLVLVTAVFVVCVRWPDLWVGVPYVRAFCEAAMVGACADWFAVVALFRHPFGLPIPHTAIIPRHKGRVAAAMGRFVETNFLAPAHIEQRLERVDACGLAAEWLTEPQNVRLVTEQVRAVLPPLIGLIGDSRLQVFAGAAFREGVNSIDAASLAARTLSVLARQGYPDKVFDQALAFAAVYVAENKDAIREQVAAKGIRWLPGWVDNKLADALVTQIGNALEAARAADHPWRARFHEEVAKWTGRLATDADLSARMEKIKADVLSSSIVDGYVAWLAREIEAKVRDDIEKSDGFFATHAEAAIVACAGWLSSDPDLRHRLNRSLRQWVLEALVPNRAEVGRFVTEIVERWDTATLVGKIETQVGKDLQYIRLNGTLVGGLVGLVIYVASHALAP